jgi:hypothetical protein
MHTTISASRKTPSHPHILQKPASPVPESAWMGVARRAGAALLAALITVACFNCAQARLPWSSEGDGGRCGVQLAVRGPCPRASSAAAGAGRGRGWQGASPPTAPCADGRPLAPAQFGARPRNLLSAGSHTFCWLLPALTVLPCTAPSGRAAQGHEGRHADRPRR